MVMNTIAMNEREQLTQTTFKALMWALSHPGRVQRLAGAGLDAFRNIGETLLDLETSYYTPNVDLNRELARNGARPLSPETAIYQFYTALSQADLENLQVAPVGSYAYPDESATLIIGCTFGVGLGLKFQGPGIKGSQPLLIGGIPESFWTLRQQTVRYPLGWDVFLISGNQAIGLPRTTIVEVC